MTINYAKKKLIISMTAIILLVLTLVGITYAYFVARINNNENTSVIVTSGKFLFSVISIEAEAEQPLS